MSEWTLHVLEKTVAAPAAGAPTQLRRPSHWRRPLLALLWGVALALVIGLLSLPMAHAQQPKGELRIGFQKSASVFVLQKSQGTLEKKLAAQGFSVKWVEFPAGPQLLEGLNLGHVDVGYVGEAPPIFAQAAGARFAYVGFDPASPEAEALVVPKDSSLKSVADLKGKRIALNKGSNVHFLLLKLLEKNDLRYSDVQTVFLPPADARAAFESGAVDAWVIWDPFLAAAQKQVGARLLADGRGVVNNYQFYLADRTFADRSPHIVKLLFEDLTERGNWVRANTRQAAALIAPLQGLDADIVESSLHRYVLGVKPLTPTVVADQQKVADAFFELKLIPKAVQVSEAAWKQPR